MEPVALAQALKIKNLFKFELAKEDRSGDEDALHMLKAMPEVKLDFSQQLELLSLNLTSEAYNGLINIMDIIFPQSGAQTQQGQYSEKVRILRAATYQKRLRCLFKSSQS